jgi:hypothetical protein
MTNEERFRQLLGETLPPKKWEDMTKEERFQYWLDGGEPRSWKERWNDPAPLPPRWQARWQEPPQRPKMTKRDLIRLAAVTVGPLGPLLLICGSDGFYLEVGWLTILMYAVKFSPWLTEIGRWTEIGEWRRR